MHKGKQHFSIIVLLFYLARAQHNFDVLVHKKKNVDYLLLVLSVPNLNPTPKEHNSHIPQSIMIYNGICHSVLSPKGRNIPISKFHNHAQNVQARHQSEA